MLFFQRDQELIRLLGSCQVQVSRAQSNADLLQVLDRLEAFPGGLEFDHAQPKLLLVLAFASLVVSYLMDGMGWMGWVAIGCCFASFLVKRGRSSSLGDLSARIGRKCSLFSNGLSEPESTADWCFKKLSSEFSDYQRGTEGRDIVTSAQGVFQGTLHSLAFEYHHLRYVNLRNDKKGGEESFDRYSLVLDFPWVRGVSARTDVVGAPLAGKGFETTLDDFNRTFLLQGRRELDCAKFATPTTLLFLMALSSRLSKVNLEFSEQGRLCLSFNNDEVMAYAYPGSLADLQAFREQIKAGIELPGLSPLLELAHQLAELHDNNFDLPSKVADKMEQ